MADLSFAAVAAAASLMRSTAASTYRPEVSAICAAGMRRARRGGRGRRRIWAWQCRSGWTPRAKRHDAKRICSGQCPDKTGAGATQIGLGADTRQVRGTW